MAFKESSLDAMGGGVFDRKGGAEAKSIHNNDEESWILDPLRIYILGIGSVGILVAHSLMRLPNPPPLTLLLHRPSLFEELKLNNGSLRLVDKGSGMMNEVSGFDCAVLKTGERLFTPNWSHHSHPFHARDSALKAPESGEQSIRSLILTCKGPATVSAIQSVKHMINSKTTICLMQNGMGQIDELNREVFSEPEERPTYVMGIISHGLYLEDTFTAVHAGHGTIALAIVRNSDEVSQAGRSGNDSSEYLLRTLLGSNNLSCSKHDYQELLPLQLEKLVVNCVLNPLTAILDIPNGVMLRSSALKDIYRELIFEISAIIQEIPEFQWIPNLRSRFSPESLTARFVNVTQTNAANSSSMREDVRNKKNTEIDYINGYLIKHAERLHITSTLNIFLMQLIKAKTQTNYEKDVDLGVLGSID